MARQLPQQHTAPGALPARTADVPRLVLAQRVIDKMVRGALLYPEPETGEAMVGLLAAQAGWQEPDIYVLDTISPGDHAVRQWGMFEQGSDWQADVFVWLHDNWEAFDKLHTPKEPALAAPNWDLPLAHVGDWHKQPGAMIAPSGGDAQTALDIIDDAESDTAHLVVPIVTMYRLRRQTGPLALDLPPVAAARQPIVSDSADDERIESETVTGSEPADEGADSASPDTVEAASDDSIPMPDSAAAETDSEAGDLAASDVVTFTASEPGNLDTLPSNTIIRRLDDEGWIIRIDFWYMSRRIRQFVPLVPLVWPDDVFPALPPIPWHLAYIRRFDQELDLLKNAGYVVDVVRWDADGRAPYEICFWVYKQGAEHVLILVTPVDYPAEQPAVRLAPLVGVADDEDVFERFYRASKSLSTATLSDWRWDSKRTLVELVWEVEKSLKDNTQEAAPQPKGGDA